MALGSRQILLDAGCDLLERLAEQLIHVVAPHLTELTPVAADARETLGQLQVELEEVNPEILQGLNVVDNSGHVSSNSAASSSRLISTIS